MYCLACSDSRVPDRSRMLEVFRVLGRSRVLARTNEYRPDIGKPTTKAPCARWATPRCGSSRRNS